MSVLTLSDFANLKHRGIPRFSRHWYRCLGCIIVERNPFFRDNLLPKIVNLHQRDVDQMLVTFCAMGKFESALIVVNYASEYCIDFTLMQLQHHIIEHLEKTCEVVFDLIQMLLVFGANSTNLNECVVVLLLNRGFDPSLFQTAREIVKRKNEITTHVCQYLRNILPPRVTSHIVKFIAYEQVTKLKICIIL